MFPINVLTLTGVSLSQWLAGEEAEDGGVAEGEEEAEGVQGDDHGAVKIASHHPAVCTGFFFFPHRKRLLNFIVFFCIFVFPYFVH